MSREIKPIGSFDAIDLFGLLRAHGGSSYTLSELADLTGRARSTVALRLDQLFDAGLVATLPGTQPTGGRRSSRIAFSSESHATVAIDIGLVHGLVALVDLSGRVVTEAAFDAAAADGPQVVLQAAMEIARTMTAERPTCRIAAIGVGVPLPVFHDEGRPINATNLPAWDGFDVAQYVAGQFAVPVLVDNDANLMALGEQALRPEVREMIVVEASTGIGAGIVSGGALLRGARGTAGAIGHIPVQRGPDRQCICGNRGCLVAVAAGPALARELRDAGFEAEGVDDVVTLARLANPVATDALRRAGNAIGEVLVSCIGFFNPAVIAAGGRLATAGDHLVAGVREVVFQKATPFATEGLQIVRSLEPVRAGLIGAGVMATEYALGRENLHRLLAS